WRSALHTMRVEGQIMIRSYTIAISEQRLAAIHGKVSNYDWSQLPDIGGWSAGVGVDDLKRLVNYWLHSYEWRDVEERLNRLPNFVTDVADECLHFLHLKGNGSKPPILL